MDEIFHVNQTKAYLAGNWSHWDPMITTPPGLYILGYIIVISIEYFTIKHIYLLSDNRHYTHILWRKVIEPNRFKLIPFYFMAVLYYFDSMLTLRNKFSFQHASTVLGHFVCICLTLIPSPLLEMRYFIIPFITWRLLSYNSSQYRWSSIVIDLLWYLFINALTFYAFAWKTFEWPDQPGVLQRFMW
ncbi:glucosyltransferase [Cichlidogyrus casuarinus]|uniref:Dol-P-Glc:Glc(2)Man(9)GlcNAc(2)-PP-Dol alpha-1,2-glucosyltransferase n=1 Tax=Cichlidogyrus casuarinus TaxID=1844966 RepID=A0ABD2QC80_9PLAT